MKRMTNKLFFYSLTSLAVMGASAAYAEQFATAPTLEGGVTASIGTWYATPSADGQNYAAIDSAGGSSTTIAEVNPDHSWGLDASLGYIFDETANGIELSYLLLNTNDSDSASENINGGSVIIPIDSQQDRIANRTDISSTLGYELNSIDLMFSQFLDIGNSVQMRFSAGAGYLNLEKEQTTTHSFEIFNAGANAFATADNASGTLTRNSNFAGIGPRVGIDGRYGFGDGFGLLAGGSVAYFVGDLEFKDTVSGHISNFNPINAAAQGVVFDGGEFEDDIDNHGVTNLRANVAIDYLYFFNDEDENGVIGLELGYLFDYYADAVQEVIYEPSNGGASINPGFNSGAYELSQTHSVSFSGPYLNLKSTF